MGHALAKGGLMYLHDALSLHHRSMRATFFQQPSMLETDPWTYRKWSTCLRIIFFCIFVKFSSQNLKGHL